MIQIATAASAHSSSSSAATACADQLGAQGLTQPHYLMVQLDARHDLAAVQSVLIQQFPGVQIHAATSCLGSMIESGTHIGPEPSLCLFAIADPEGDYGTASIAVGDKPRQDAAAVTRAALLAANRLGESPALVWLSSAPGCEETIIAGIQDVVGVSTPIVGGSAADNEISGQWQVMANHLPIGSGIVVSVLFPSVPIGTAFHSGYVPSTTKGRVSRCEGRRVFEIDGEAAADVYAKWSQGAVGRPQSGTINVLMPSALWPLGRQVKTIGGADIYMLSHPETLSEDGSMTLFTDIAVGDELVLMRGTIDSLLERPALVSAAACRIGEIPSNQVSGMILVFCAGCMLTVKDRLDEVRRSLNAALPGVPFIAAFTFGEQGPAIANLNGHGNLMISAVMLGQRHAGVA